VALRPIDIGETNRTCTGTNAVTGRDAALTSWSPFRIANRRWPIANRLSWRLAIGHRLLRSWCSHVDLHHEPSPSHGEMQHSYTLGAWRPWPDSHRLGSG
jgi:hypothetical protein